MISFSKSKKHETFNLQMQVLIMIFFFYCKDYSYGSAFVTVERGQLKKVNRVKQGAFPYTLSQQYLSSV